MKPSQNEILADNIYTIQYFQWKWSHLYYNFIEFIPRVSFWQHASTGSGSGLVPFRKHPIIWAFFGVIPGCMRYPISMNKGSRLIYTASKLSVSTKFLTK